MRKKRQDEANALKQLHEEITSFPSLYRQAICQECNWSLPTYYRKIRNTGTPELSNMEIKTAINIALSITLAMEMKIKEIAKEFNKPTH
ncbi:hypothetical protein [Chitinophaga varians]|uniref:hypothetical protein n=1 Tax=Chitinophaga varians TaxID=2202339 RepID=UPI00165F9A34|nr:hypothetical protein [Chitinophaga varians]MBC9910574.1 hypothetical protein [Chitinophaga varians]